jgi:hypothetical protein
MGFWYWCQGGSCCCCLSQQVILLLKYCREQRGIVKGETKKTQDLHSFLHRSPYLTRIEFSTEIHR